MNIMSYMHGLDGRIRIRWGGRMPGLPEPIAVADWLKLLLELRAVQLDEGAGELLILFNQERIDGQTLLHLLGYSGAMGTRPA